MSKSNEKEEVVEKPTAQGDEKTVEQLNFFVPQGFNSNSYNGMMGIYDFYTGENSGLEVNVVVVVTYSGNFKDMSAKDYILKESNTAKSIKLDKVSEETINGSKWYLFSNSNNYYYASLFNDSLYEVTISKKSDPDNIFKNTNEMVKKTLFFVK